MTTIYPLIPYIKQSESPGKRSCGAACLSMVYASLGLRVDQNEIWPKIARKNAFGSLASTTHLMARDAIERGFDAVVIQASHPLQALKACRDNGLRVILNHRLTRESPAGHYSVLADIERSDVILHDPLAGPSRRLVFPQLLDLWRPGVPISEIIGNVLLAIAPKQSGSVQEPAPECGICKLAIPEQSDCPRCKKPVRLRPSASLGCIAAQCAGRMWRYLCCPECDCLWSFHGKSEARESDAAPAPNSSTPPVDPTDVDQIYGEIDKFLNQVLAIPGASDHEDIRKQIAYLYAQKEVLRMSMAETASNRQAALENLAVASQAGQMGRAFEQKRAEDAARPSPPLDGDELGMSLLRNLGFVR